MNVKLVLRTRSDLAVSQYDVNMSVHTASALPSAKRLFFPGGFVLLVDNFDVDIGVGNEQEHFIVNLRPPFRIESQSGKSKKLNKSEEEAVAVECLRQAFKPVGKKAKK